MQRKLSYRPSDGATSFNKLSYHSSDVTTSLLFKQGNGLTSEVIAHVRISRKSFFLNFAFTGKVQQQSQNFISLTILPLIGLALGYFILVLNPLKPKCL